MGGLPLALLDDQSCAGDLFVAAGVIEVKMRVDQEVDALAIALETLEPPGDLLAGLELELDQVGEVAHVLVRPLLADRPQTRVEERCAQRVNDQVAGHGNPNQTGGCALDQCRQRHLQPTACHRVELKAHA